MGLKKRTKKLTINVPKRPLSGFTYFIKTQRNPSNTFKSLSEQYANLTREEQLKLEQESKKISNLEAYEAFRDSVKKEREKIKVSLDEIFGQTKKH
jgi:hypothetical protein